MCGIAGFFDENLPFEENHQSLVNMLRAIDHRGPDGTGTLSTDSLEVSVAEISLVNSISIGGTSTNSETSSNVTSFTHKLPVVINGETYSLLLKQ